MAISLLPSLSRSDPAFQSDVDTFFGTQLPNFSSEINIEINRINQIGFGSYSATSTTTNTIGTGTKTFTIETGKGFVAGQAIMITSNSNPTALYMIGQVVAYDINTGALSVNVNSASGSGTLNDWTLSLSASSGGVPVGSVIYVANNMPPSGYIKANGATISRIAYADLFNAIGTIFGSGDGSTTFKIPDLRGEFVRGWDDSRAVDSGRVFGSSQAGSVESHTHGYATPAYNANLFASGSTYAGSGSSGATNAYGGAETRPRNVALLACIKY